MSSTVKCQRGIHEWGAWIASQTGNVYTRYCKICSKQQEGIAVVDCPECGGLGYIRGVDTHETCSTCKGEPTTIIKERGTALKHQANLNWLDDKLNSL